MAPSSLAHLNYKTLKFIIKSKLVLDAELEGKENMNVDGCFEKCETCVLAKHKREPYNNVVCLRSRHPLQLVHSDICGDISPPSYSDERYSVTFTDDFTGFKCVYPIFKKSDTFEKFMEYENYITSCFRKEFKIVSVRCDQGGEYRDC